MSLKSTIGGSFIQYIGQAFGPSKVVRVIHDTWYLLYLLMKRRVSPCNGFLTSENRTYRKKSFASYWIYFIANEAGLGVGLTFVNKRSQLRSMSRSGIHSCILISFRSLPYQFSNTVTSLSSVLCTRTTFLDTFICISALGTPLREHFMRTKGNRSIFSLIFVYRTIQFSHRGIVWGCRKLGSRYRTNIPSVDYLDRCRKSFIIFEAPHGGIATGTSFAS